MLVTELDAQVHIPETVGLCDTRRRAPHVSTPASGQHLVDTDYTGEIKREYSVLHNFPTMTLNATTPKYQRGCGLTIDLYSVILSIKDYSVD
ncbi:unnamed protein product [Calicophoron daubneyi]